MKKRNKLYTVLAAFGTFALSIIGPISRGMDVAGETGVLAFGLGMIYLIIGVFLLISRKTREIGTTLLICAGIILLIGYAVCTKSL